MFVFHVAVDVLAVHAREPLLFRRAQVLRLNTVVSMAVSGHVQAQRHQVDYTKQTCWPEAASYIMIFSSFTCLLKFSDHGFKVVQVPIFHYIFICSIASLINNDDIVYKQRIDGELITRALPELNPHKLTGVSDLRHLGWGPFVNFTRFE